jgi:hypothetical protein
MSNRFVSVLLLIALGSIARAAEWEPARTHAVIVGVLSWPEEGLKPFPEKNRKDQELRDVLVRRGVPADQVILLLDKAATKTSILRALRHAAEKAKPQDTLIFYYAGHGAKTGRDIAFANYDINPRDCANTGLLLSVVSETLARFFRGSKVVLWADACHSGGLARVADRLAEAKISAVSLTSSEASNLSTRNWTFTQSILDGISGSALCDANRDGVITLDELAAEVRDAMTFREGQRSGFVNRGVPGDFVMSKARTMHAERGQGNLAIGRYVWAKDNERFRAARIVGRDGNKPIVQFFDYTEKHEKTLNPSDVKVQEFQHFPVGSQLQVQWGGKPWAAKVLQVQGDFHLVHYEKYDDSWDEWVLSHRIITNADAEVEWNGKWYPATIVKRDGGRFYIHYLGFDHSWDEWVTDRRIKLSKK